MAERKSGAVKPPVIDLKAREAAAETADVAEEKAMDDKVAEAPRQPAPRPPARLAMPWSAIAIAAVGGAVLGTAATYGVASFVSLPDRRAEIADPAPALVGLSEEIRGFDGRLAAVEQQARNTQVSLDATVTQLDTGLSELRQAIADAGANQPQPVDLAPLEAQVAALEDRLTVSSAGAGGGEDATALAETLTATEAAIATLRTEVTALTEQLAAQQVALDAAETAIATRNQSLDEGAVGPAVRLPLLVAALESAVANGRPFTAELAAVTALLPDLDVPPEVRSGAEIGMPRPDAVADAMRLAIPSILAGRAANGTGDVGADALEWVRGLLALRPAGEIAGDHPEAVVSRLEAAVARRDFAAADALLKSLPDAMRLAAGPIEGQIATLAAGDAFIAGLRTRALGPAT